MKYIEEVLVTLKDKELAPVLHKELSKLTCKEDLIEVFEILNRHIPNMEINSLKVFANYFKLVNPYEFKDLVKTLIQRLIEIESNPFKYFEDELINEVIDENIIGNSFNLYSNEKQLDELSYIRRFLINEDKNKLYEFIVQGQINHLKDLTLIYILREGWDTKIQNKWYFPLMGLVVNILKIKNKIPSYEIRITEANHYLHRFTQ